MASLPNAPSLSTKGRKFQPSVRVDMTPLVDLGFLLITFFVFTSTLGSSAVMPLMMPKEGPPSNTGASSTLTLLAGANNKVYAYSGFWETARQHQAIYPTSYSVAHGIGTLIRSKKAELAAAGKAPADLVLLIKPTDEASYKNLVDLLDEAVINGVSRYAVMAPEPYELAFMAVR